MGLERTIFLAFFSSVSARLLQIFDYLTYSYGAFTSAILNIFPGGPPAHKVYQPNKGFCPVLLITGTSTGIGNELAIRSALDGYTVVAGVRREVDGKKLLNDLEIAKSKIKQNHLEKSDTGCFRETSGEILPLILDVTSPPDIANARKYIDQITTERGVPFVSLINNAGTVYSKPLEFCNREKIAKLYEVNVFGPFDLIYQLLPLLRRDSGRIINIGSIAGEGYAKLSGPYSGTKAAMRAMTAVLRQETRDFGVAVALISPGFIKSQIFSKETSTTKEFLVDGQKNNEYDLVGCHEFYRKTALNRLSLFDKLEELGLHPSHVYQAVQHAMTSRFPLTTYYVGWDSKFISVMVSLLGERLTETILAGAERIATPTDNGPS